MPDRLPTFAFSSLGCPEWSTDEVVVQAAAIGYDAIEWRGGSEGHVSTAWSARRRSALRRHMADLGIAAVAVTSYTNFVTAAPQARTATIDHLRGHLELAADLGAPTVRAFVGIVDDDAAHPALLDRVVTGLAACLETARAMGVAIALEPHDDFVTATSIAPILARLDPSPVGAVWDIANAWGGGEDPAAGLAAIGDRIRYVQVKDARWVGQEWQLTPLGGGAVPLGQALRTLATIRPLPPLSLEWERAWHPELDPAGIALPRELAAMRRLASEATGPTP